MRRQKPKSYVPEAPPVEGQDIGWSKAQRVVFPNLKFSTQAISVRLPTDMLEQLTAAANKRNVPCPSLMKVWLAERLTRERKAA
jgi:hypothetical protein